MWMPFVTEYTKYYLKTLIRFLIVPKVLLDIELKIGILFFNIITNK